MGKTKKSALGKKSGPGPTERQGDGPGISKASDSEAPPCTKAEKKAEPSSKTPATHVVAKGETPSTIAARYKVKTSDLFQWNHWKNGVVLQVGQKVVLQAP